MREREGMRRKRVERCLCATLVMCKRSAADLRLQIYWSTVNILLKLVQKGYNIKNRFTKINIDTIYSPVNIYRIQFIHFNALYNSINIDTIYSFPSNDTL